MSRAAAAGGGLPAGLAGGARGIAVVASAFAFFLLWAQFGFLRLLEARGGGPAALQGAMAAMGIAGLLTSLATGALLGRVSPLRVLRGAFPAAAAVALGSLAARGTAALFAAAALTGAVVAVLTVAVASDLPALAGRMRPGLAAGLGTGAAYFLCNIPRVFEARPDAQAVIVAAACAAGLAAVWLPGRSDSGADPEAGVSRGTPPVDRGGLDFAGLVLSLLALVWLDSAAFRIIQETVALKGLTWGEGGLKIVQGSVHLAAAAGAGWLVGRGRMRPLLPAAYGLFVAGFALLARAETPVLAGGPLYAAGISLYSVALVVAPSLGPRTPGSLPARARAAILFGAAGWIGSALGVGMAQDLHRIPPLFLLAAGLVLLGGMILAHAPEARAILRLFGVPALCGLAALGVHAIPHENAPGGSPEERGRKVYLSEGCIHCHSQFVRAGMRDETWWGPVRPPGPGERPPLIGNRRQGPDLTNVGNRRGAAWHRVHLANPRVLSPGSRMPSYGHLFRGGQGAGEDLVAYLSTLGGGTETARWEASRRWSSSVPPGEGKAERGASLFRAHCAACHGTDGRGDGPAAAPFRKPAMNLRKPSYVLVSWGPGAEPVGTGLARLLKFGMPGTLMPGHEYLPDRDIADLVAHVESLRGTDPGAARIAKGEAR